MRSTLPLSSFPLHLILHFEKYYTLLLSIFIFLLVLFKTYNLPYTSAMGAQEGIILLIFIFFTRVRVRQGLGANQVVILLTLDWKFNKNGNFRADDVGWVNFEYLLCFSAVLRPTGLNHPLFDRNSHQLFGNHIRIFCVLAIPELREATVITLFIFSGQSFNINSISIFITIYYSDLLCHM